MHYYLPCYTSTGLISGSSHKVLCSTAQGFLCKCHIWLVWLNPLCTSQNKLHDLDLKLVFKRIHNPPHISSLVHLCHWSAASSSRINAPVHGAAVAPVWHSCHCLVAGLLQRVSCQEGWLWHGRACHRHPQQHPYSPCNPCSAAALSAASLCWEWMRVLQHHLHLLWEGMGGIKEWGSMEKSLMQTLVLWPIKWIARPLVNFCPFTKWAASLSRIRLLSRFT